MSGIKRIDFADIKQQITIFFDPDIKANIAISQRHGTKRIDAGCRPNYIKLRKFSRLVCLKEPYFGSIRPQFVDLRPNHCEVRIAKRRSVLNHIGTVHAIAMCNMAELAAGTMTEVSVAAHQRWIPKGMTVEYLKKATTHLVATARPAQHVPLPAEGDYTVRVEVHDLHDEMVFQAEVTMWVSAKMAPG